MKMNLLLAMLLLLCCLFLSRTSRADSNVTFKNDSSRTLHIYYVSAPNGTTIACESLTYGGSFSPGAAWSYSVGAEQWGWVRFQENTQGNGCFSNNNKFETRIAGSAGNRTEIVSVQ
jgi:hypothetical protein